MNKGLKMLKGTHHRWLKRRTYKLYDQVITMKNGISAVVGAFLLLTIIFSSGCTQVDSNVIASGGPDKNSCDCQSGFECSDGTCIKTPESVVKEYTLLMSSDSVNERIENFKTIANSYTTGYWKEHISLQYDYLTKSKSSFDNFISSAEIVCTPAYGVDECGKTISELKDSFEGYGRIKKELESVSTERIDDNNIRVDAETNTVIKINATKKTVSYFLVKENNSWLIQDSLDDEGVKYSVSLSNADFSKNLQETLINQTKFQDGTLQNFIKIGKDGCSYLNDEYKDKTSEEKRLAFEQCYRDDYFQKAVYKKDASVCNDISSDYNYAMCYSEVAIALRNSSTCDSIDDRVYEARIGTLSTKDVCYDTFAYKIGTKEKAKDACEKIADEAFRENCLHDILLLFLA